MRKMADIVRNQDPVTLPPSATVREACQSMRDRRVGAVLVTEGDRCLVGVFTLAGTPCTGCWLKEGAPPTRHWSR
jgi:hypothetical protein